MLAMTKSEMAQYLFDYARLCDSMIHNPDVPAIKLFANNMYRDGRQYDINQEYFDRMIDTYITYTYFKKFSVLEDFLLNRDDFLNNEDLVGLKDGISHLVAPNNLSDKRIVQLIRNAFNHNGEPDSERFKISKYVTRFEVNLKDIRTDKEKQNNVPAKPFNIIFNHKYLVDLYHLIQTNSRNVMITSYDIPDDFDYNSNTLKSDLAKIKVIRYYITKKLEKEERKKFLEFHKRVLEPGADREKLNKEFHEYASTITTPVIQELTNDQINTLAFMIVNMRRNSNVAYLEGAGLHAIYCMINKVVPVPMLKTLESDEQLSIAFIIGQGNLSFMGMVKHISELVTGDDLSLSEGDSKKFFEMMRSVKESGELVDMYYDILDGKFFQDIPFINYIDAVVTHCCYDDIINVNGLKYDKERVRNSLVHRRWFIDQDNKIVLYDADPRNIKDNELTLVGKIDINEFIIWAKNYMKGYGTAGVGSKKL